MLDDLFLDGTGVSPGIAIGPALILDRRLSPVPRLTFKAGTVSGEIERVNRALLQARRELEELQSKTEHALGASMGHLFEAQRMMLEDPALVSPIMMRIETRGQNAEWAVKSVGVELSDQLAKVSDAYLSDRCSDIDDITDRLLRILGGEQPFRLDDLVEPVVLFAYGLSPSDTVMINPGTVLGFATDVGTGTSHSAIMARTLEIPAVVGLGGATEKVASGDPVILDGGDGVVIVHPTLEQTEQYKERQDAFVEIELHQLEMRELPAITPDGHDTLLLANIDTPGEVRSAIQHGAQGVGLYRSEYLYLRRAHPPDEEMHYREYRDVLKQMNSMPVTVRTMDLGGEKFPPVYMARDHEAEAFLGVRGIRHSLRKRELFIPQLRGLLRASVHGQLRIILPFVSSLDELRLVKRLFEETRDEVMGEGHGVSSEIEIGVMVEVPATALIIDHFAPEVAFLSIGTNDLIQHLLAVDRTNEEVAELYQPLHPAVLRMLSQVTEVACQYGVPVGVCGEAASDPLVALVLLGFEFDELSMSPMAIPGVKNVIRHVPLSESKEVLEQALTMATAREVEELAMARLMAHFPDGFLAHLEQGAAS